MVTGLHCQNLTGDRNLGAYWERQFCLQAAQYKKIFTPMQLGKKDSVMAFSLKGAQWQRYTLPDVTIWTAPGEHHEIKHKSPFNDRNFGPSFGLEVYRFNALLWFTQETGQNVLYTIHDHSKSGGRDALINDIRHWLTAGVMELNKRWHTQRQTKSWVNGQEKYVDTYYWAVGLWQPLENYWKTV